MSQEESSPTQTTQPQVNELDFTKPDYSFTPKGAHDWKQHGPYVICRSCDLEHAIYIGIEKMMVGIEDDGTPKLVDRKKYFAG